MKENSPMTPSKSSDTKPLGLTKKISKDKGQNSIQSVSSPSQARKRLKRLGTDPLFKSRQMLDGKKSNRAKYRLGQHGAKKREQQRLKTSGKTHESEHTIGFEVLNRGSDDKRGQSSDVKQFENEAYAYQEAAPLHRTHIGTGMHSEKDASGMNSQAYRDSQRALLENGGESGVSSAVQLNQLGYAFDPNFKKDTSDLSKADNSYNAMVAGMDDVEYKTGPDSSKKAPVDEVSRVEMYLARIAARTGVWPTEEIDAQRERMGLSQSMSDDSIVNEDEAEEKDVDVGPGDGNTDALDIEDTDMHNLSSESNDGDKD